jgi:hypothetical protein
VLQHITIAEEIIQNSKNLDQNLDSNLNSQRLNNVECVENFTRDQVDLVAKNVNLKFLVWLRIKE